MTSLFPEAEHKAAPQAINYDDVPEGVATNFSQLLDWFTPNIYVCWIIMALNVLVFGAMLVSGVNPEKMSVPSMIHWGVDQGPLTITQGQWWRMISSAFIHFGFTHIAFNMIVLYQIGPFMERFLGNLGFLFVYLAAAVSGAVCSLAWDPYIYSAGASGAIFGLYGALIGFLILRHDSIPRANIQALLRGALLFIGYNAVFGFIHAGTDIAGHVGGLVGGFVCGLIVSTPITPGFRQRRFYRALAASAVCVIASLTVLHLLPKPVDLQATIKTFTGVEKSVVAQYKAILSNAAGHSDDETAANIQSKVIAPWDKARRALPDSARMPALQREWLGDISTYMDEREKAWGMLVSGLKQRDAAAMERALATEKEVTEKAASAMAKLGN